MVYIESQNAFTYFFRKFIVRTSDKNDIYITLAPASSLGIVQSFKSHLNSDRGCVNLVHLNKNLQLIRNQQ